MEIIKDQLLKYATGNFNVRSEQSDKGDDLDAIILALNTLGEELNSSGRAIRDYEKRVSGIMNILLRYTILDFSEKAEVSSAGDEIDAIAVGLNTLAEELEERIDKVRRLNMELEQNVVRLEEANAELEAFTYSVSHDLRAPLRAIHGYTKVLSKDYAGNLDADAQTMMDAVMNNAKKMGQLIDDLLALSRLGRKELQKRTVDLTSLAKAVWVEIQKTMDCSKVSMTIHDLPEAEVDFSLMTQVFTNLISNAVKYSSLKKDPEIEIGFWKDKRETIYYIKDNGVGFDMRYYNKLFGVFQRLHDAGEYEGTGVGLALVKRIISKHHGKVWAEAEPDKGATFYFTLSK